MAYPRAVPARPWSLVIALLMAALGLLPSGAEHALAAPRPAEAAVPECHAPVVGAVQASPSASPEIASRTVVYGLDDGLPLMGQLTAPAGVDGPLPTVLVVHGGAWAHGSPSLMAPVAAALARAGFVAFNIAYSLATPTSPGFPGQLDELEQAVEYLRADAASLDVAPERIGVLGSSAGGNLALLLATTGHGSCLAGHRVAAVVTWSAPVDLANYGRDNERYCRSGLTECPLLFRSEREYIGCPYAACAERWQEASVLPDVRPDDPPTLLFNSSDEIVPLSQPRDLVERLTADHVPCRLVVLPGHRHAIAYADEAIAATITFFREYLS